MVCENSIILIPGVSDIDEKDFFLHFLEGLMENEKIDITYKESQQNGHTVRQIEYKNCLIDIYGTNWVSLMPRLSQKPLKTKLFRSFYLFIYWVFSKIWWVVLECPLLVFSFIYTLIIFCSWCFLTGLIAFLAVSNQVKDIFGNTPLQVGREIGYLWIVASILIFPFPVDNILDYADFTARYLTDSFLRYKIRDQVLVTLNTVLAKKDYKKVIIVGHSLGGLIATDLLAYSCLSTEKSIEYITLGTPLKFLCYKNKQINQMVEKCLNNLQIINPKKSTLWDDYYSDQDWLCTAVPFKKGLNSHKVIFKSHFSQKLSGIPHKQYFSKKALITNSSRTVISQILDR